MKSNRGSGQNEIIKPFSKTYMKMSKSVTLTSRSQACVKMVQILTKLNKRLKSVTLTCKSCPWVGEVQNKTFVNIYHHAKHKPKPTNSLNYLEISKTLHKTLMWKVSPWPWPAGHRYRWGWYRKNLRLTSLNMLNINPTQQFELYRGLKNFNRKVSLWPSPASHRHG